MNMLHLPSLGLGTFRSGEEVPHAGGAWGLGFRMKELFGTSTLQACDSRL